jgi:hypothetical protein
VEAGRGKGCVRHRIEGSAWDWQGVCSAQDRGMGLTKFSKKALLGVSSFGRFLTKSHRHLFEISAKLRFF